ncbi:Gfo/Idh/MocA family protein [Roseomonas fluvialis]|uniref:Oxidoreductase n=1 Tax=Roseomonas fluvialis TaxID=1750527 RepID=A0ABM7Y7Z9_9PROT|nr:Gfo/Idh/MocA family oxidoreductase [Roseomonas fluvialis]BDG74029.1 oxidoreductase [Roseomonas fluvialis]
MRQVSVGIIGVGWVGGVRANALADHPQVRALHICDIRQDRLAEVAGQTRPTSAVEDYRRLLENPDIDMVYVCTTPESTHYPITRDVLLAGKHVMVEKPLAQTTAEADDLIAIANRQGLKLSVGYSQRFNPRFAYVRKAIQEGMIGEPVTCLVSRNVTRELGTKVTGRTRLSPAAMEATHDIDFLMWCLQPRKPIRVFSQASGKYMKQFSETLDHQWVMITMDDGTTVNVGAGWILPLGYPNYSHTWIEIIGTEGSLTVDDSHKEVSLNTVAHGIRYPMSSMPGEAVDHVYAGPMSAETLHFLDAVARDRGVLVKAEEARAVMDIYNAADIAADRHEAVALPRNS